MANSDYLDFLLRPESWYGDNVDAVDPIRVLSAHHHLQYRLCDMLIDLARDPQHRNAEMKAAAALDYLCVSLPLHEIDEDEDLRCAMRASCPHEPELAGLFDLLAKGHATDRALCEPVCEGLAQRAMGRMPKWTGAFVIALYKYSESLRRHLQWEDWVLLPLVAEQLSPESRASLLTCIAQRRSEITGGRRGHGPRHLAGTR